VPQNITLSAPTITLTGATIAAGISGSGSLTLNSPAAAPGYVAFFDATGARVGYIGYSDGVSHLQLDTEGSYLGYVVTGTLSVQGAFAVGGVAGPTWTTGSAAPASTQPVGSLYSRVGGAVGATLYVSRGGGTWAAVAGV
jgi:hypothetical protein